MNPFLSWLAMSSHHLKSLHWSDVVCCKHASSSIKQTHDVKHTLCVVAVNHKDAALCLLTSQCEIQRSTWSFCHCLWHKGGGSRSGRCHPTRTGSTPPEDTNNLSKPARHLPVPWTLKRDNDTDGPFKWLHFQTLWTGTGRAVGQLHRNGFNHWSFLALDLQYEWKVAVIYAGQTAAGCFGGAKMLKTPAHRSDVLLPKLKELQCVK